MILTRNAANLFLALCTLPLASCSFNPFTTDNNMTGSAAPAAAGGAIGAGTAALLGGTKYVIGLAGLSGAAVGYYVSTLNFAAGGVTQVGGQVYTQGDYITIEIPTDNIFDTNSSEVLPEAGPALQSAVEVLRRYPNSNILVSGNTSGYGTRRYEQKLSENRAREVAAYLWAHGINAFKGTDFDPSSPTRKLSYVGYGNYFPIANNIKSASIRSNSRIQITAYPSKYQLGLCKDQKVFANIGGLNEPPLSKSTPEPYMGNAFKGEALPETPAVGNNPNSGDEFLYDDSK